MWQTTNRWTGRFPTNRSYTDKAATLRVINEENIDMYSSLDIVFMGYEKHVDRSDREMHGALLDT